MPREHPAPLKRGEDSRENWRTINQLNELLQPYISEIRRLSSAVADLRMRPNVKEGGGGGGKVEQFRFKSHNADTITCVPWDGTTEGAPVTIYKPWLLRRTPFDGKTRVLQTDRTPPTLTVTYVYSSNSRRTKSAGDIAESQYITPGYTLDDVIYAVPCDQIGGAYLDINADGRAWAEGDQ